MSSGANRGRVLLLEGRGDRVEARRLVHVLEERLDRLADLRVRVLLEHLEHLELRVDELGVLGVPALEPDEQFLDELLLREELLQDAHRQRDALGLGREGTHRLDGLAARRDDALETGLFLFLIGDRRVGREREALQQRLDRVRRPQLAELGDGFLAVVGLRALASRRLGILRGGVGLRLLVAAVLAARVFAALALEQIEEAHVEAPFSSCDPHGSRYDFVAFAARPARETARGHSSGTARRTTSLPFDCTW